MKTLIDTIIDTGKGKRLQPGKTSGRRNTCGCRKCSRKTGADLQYHQADGANGEIQYPPDNSRRQPILPYYKWKSRTADQIRKLPSQKLMEDIRFTDMLLSVHRSKITTLGFRINPKDVSSIMQESALLQKELQWRIDNINVYERRTKGLYRTEEQKKVLLRAKEEYELLQKEYLKDKYIGAWNKRHWDWMTLKAVEELGDKLFSVIPTDIAQFCPNYEQLSYFKRRLFWVSLIAAMAKFESGFDTRVSYRESFGVISRGLLQISIERARENSPRYKPHYLNIKPVDQINSDADLHIPEKNIRLGVRILNYWVGQHKRIAGSSRQAGKWKHFGGAQHWSVLRSSSSKTREKLQAIQHITKASLVCKTA